MIIEKKIGCDISMIRSFISRMYVKCKYRHVRVLKNTIISRNSSFEGFNTIGMNSVVHCKMGFASCVGAHAEISADIGRFSMIGDNVKTIQFTHPVTGFVSIHPCFYSVKKQSGFSFVTEQKYSEEKNYDEETKIGVKIGSDVWIGSNVTILGGLSIGDGAVIGAGAVVTKNVEPYSIVAGVPAKEIKKRFNQSVIEFLQNDQWWNKDLSWIKRNSFLFDDVEKYMSYCSSHLENEIR